MLTSQSPKKGWRDKALWLAFSTSLDVNRSKEALDLGVTEGGIEVSLNCGTSILAGFSSSLGED